MANKNYNINPMKMFFIIAPIIGIILGVIYIQNEEKHKKQIQNLPAENSKKRNRNQIDSLQYYKNLVCQKDSVILKQKKIIEELRKQETIIENNELDGINSKKIEEVFDRVFVDIACITAKFMLNKAGSNSSFISCNKSFAVFLASLSEYPSAYECLQKAKQDNYVHGKDIYADISSINQYIDEILNYLRSTGKYPNTDLLNLETQFQDIVNSAKNSLVNN